MEHLKDESEKSSTLKDVVIISSVIALLSLTLSRNFEVRENVLSAGKKLNVTPLCNESLLIFNRVPKVISQTDLHFDVLGAKENNFIILGVHKALKS